MNSQVDEVFAALTGRFAEVARRAEEANRNVQAAATEQRAAVERSAALEARIEEIEANLEARTRQSLERRLPTRPLKELKHELEAKVAEWRAKRDRTKLEARAKDAEDYARAVTEDAIVAVDEAEVAVLEALAARSAAAAARLEEAA